MTEVKNKILDKIRDIENDQLLNNILDLLQNVNTEGEYQFSESQKADIDESISQIERGEYTSHEVVMKLYKK